MEHYGGPARGRSRAGGNTGTINSVGIVTRNRTTDLVSCVESHLDHCRRHGRDPEFIVLDDSRSGEVEDRTRMALRQLADRFTARIRYAGTSEKSRFAEALARESSIARNVVDFGFFGDRRCGLFTGANRNGLLLDTIDDLVFGADDDTRAHAAVAQEHTNSISVSSEYEPREFWFFPDRRAALEAVASADSDVLTGHEQFLGRTLAEVGALAAVDGMVTITLPGLVGDSGMGSPHYLLTLGGTSRERLLASRTAYASALRSREVLRTVRQPTIAASAFCMTTFFGFDNRLLLPPFFPVARNSDGLFGVMVRRAIEGSHIAFLPPALLHAPRESRGFAGDEAWTEPERIRMADVLIASILAVHPGPPAAGPGDRLRRLGAYLRELASLETRGFEAFVRGAQQMRNLTFTALLETRLGEHGGRPAYWAEDVRKTIEYLRRAAAGKDYVVPRDLGDALDVDAARLLTRELVEKFGELLEAWPVLVEAARQLRARGCRVSDPV